MRLESSGSAAEVPPGIARITGACGGASAGWMKSKGSPGCSAAPDASRVFPSRPSRICPPRKKQMGPGLTGFPAKSGPRLYPTALLIDEVDELNAYISIANRGLRSTKKGQPSRENAPRLSMPQPLDSCERSVLLRAVVDGDAGQIEIYGAVL